MNYKSTLQMLFMATFWIFSLPFYHFELFGLAAPIPVIILLLYMMVWFVDGNYYPTMNWHSLMLAATIGGYFTILSLSELANINNGSIVFVAKNIITILLIFGFLLLFNQHDERAVKKGIKIGMVSLSVTLTVFIYYYFYVFNMEYLGTNLFEAGRYGKNQFAYFLSRYLFLLIILFLIYEIKLKKYYLLLFFFLVAILLSSSRGAYIVTVLSLLTLALANMRIIISFVYSRTLFSIFLFFVLAMCFYIIIISNNEIPYRIISIFDPGSLSESHENLGRNSYKERFGRILSIGRVVSENPFFGGGSNFVYTYDLRGKIHNDYASLLGGHGLAGLISYILMYVSFCWLLFKKKCYNSKTCILAKQLLFIMILSNLTIGMVYDQYLSIYPLFFVLIPIVLFLNRSYQTVEPCCVYDD